MQGPFYQDLLLVADINGFGVAAIRSGSNGKATVVRGFGRRIAAVEGEVGEFLNLRVLSASVED